MIALQLNKIAEFCQRHGVRRLSLFGSGLRDDFGPDSDVDVLVEFESGRGFTFENTPVITDELRAIFGRPVDVVEKGRIRNRFRREAILSSYRVVYGA